MNVDIQVASSADLESLRADLVDIYRLAFRERPYGKTPAEVREFAHFLPIHAGEPGYRLVVARDSDQGKAVGFIYGRTVLKGQPWHDLVEGPMQAAGLRGWMEDAYQIVELAVTPAAQRHGIGGQLHDRLLADLHHRRALLTTMAAETPAYHFYANKGWRVLLQEIIVPQIPRPYRLMGLELPHAQAHAHL
jgi:ribosomal protein S18 acetylase RimI-like enzyme